MTSSIFKQIDMTQGLLDSKHDVHHSIVATLNKRYEECKPGRRGNLAEVWRLVADKKSDGKSSYWIRSGAMWASKCRISGHRKKNACRCWLRCRCCDSERRADKKSVALAKKKKTLRVVVYSERKYCPQCERHFQELSKSVPVECWWSVSGDKELDEQFAQACDLWDTVQ